MESPTTVTNNPAVRATGTAIANSGRRSKWVLLGVSVGCYVFVWWITGQLGMTVTRGFNGSLLLSGQAGTNVLVTAMLVYAAVMIGSTFAGRVRPDAGLFAAAVGLWALTNRGRPVYAVLHDTGGSRNTYLLLALELLILGALLGAGWWLLFRLRLRGLLQSDSARDGLADVDQPSSVGWIELGTHVLVTAALVVLIAQTEDKKQVLAAVAIGSFAAAFFPHWRHGARPSIWYWPGPLIVGVIGYVLAWFNLPADALHTGRPHGGILSALARPLPLDYAGIGTAAALLGYWMRRKSLREREIASSSAAG